MITDLTGEPAAGALNFRFTDFSLLAQDTYHMYVGSTVINLQDCQLHSGFLVGSGGSMNLTNCLLERVLADLENLDGLIPVIRNNTFFGGEFAFNPQPTNAILADNLFDHTVFDYDLSGHGYAGAFNAYATNASVTNLQRQLPAQPTDIILASSPNYQTGPLGSYYQLASSALFNADTNKTAGQVGLFHYTTITNLVSGYEIKETNSWLDVGLHYVATDANGNPIDTSGKGIPDYLQDANGNGVVDSGETDWTSFTDLGLKVLITKPSQNATIP